MVNDTSIPIENLLQHDLSDIPGYYATATKKRALLEDIQDIETAKAEFLQWTPRPWQSQLMNRLTQQPDNRTIIWIEDTIGNTGKSELGEYMELTHGYQTLKGGSYNDLAYIINKKAKGWIFDYARCATNNQSATSDNRDVVSYKMLEHLKDRKVFSCKYESRTVRVKRGHVIVLSNHPPSDSALSKDRLERWIIDSVTLTMNMI